MRIEGSAGREHLLRARDTEPQGDRATEGTWRGEAEIRETLLHLSDAVESLGYELGAMDLDDHVSVVPKHDAEDGSHSPSVELDGPQGTLELGDAQAEIEPATTASA